jgi:hypothetical protein
MTNTRLRRPRRSAWSAPATRIAFAAALAQVPAPAVAAVRVVSAPSGWQGPVVYAAPTSRGVVDVYRGGPTKPIRPIYSFDLDPGVANSLVVDSQRNLFLADSYSTWVFEYAPGTSTPSKRFPTAMTPDNIAVRGDTLYVFEAMESGGSASIALYEHGGVTVTRSLTDPRIVLPQGMAVDRAGNVFVGYSGSGFRSGIGEFVGGKMPMKRLDIALFPLSLGIDSAGNLLVDAPDSGSDLTSSISVFPPGLTTPIGTIPHLPWLYQFSLTANGQYFYAGDMGRGKSFQMYEYPSGALVYSRGDREAFEGYAGIAASPAAPVGVW